MSTQPTRPYVRSPKKFLIYPKFQLLLLGVNFSIMFGVMLIFWAATQNAVANLEPVGRLSGIEFETYKRVLEYHTAQFNRALGFSLVVGTLVSGGLTLIISHRIAGPLVRLRAYFRSISERGKVPGRLEFRDGDYLSEIPPLVNAAIARLQEKESRPQLTVLPGGKDKNDGQVA